MEEESVYTDNMTLDNMSVMTKGELGKHDPMNYQSQIAQMKIQKPLVNQQNFKFEQTVIKSELQYLIKAQDNQLHFQEIFNTILYQNKSIIFISLFGELTMKFLKNFVTITNENSHHENGILINAQPYYFRELNCDIYFLVNFFPQNNIICQNKLKIVQTIISSSVIYCLEGVLNQQSLDPFKFLKQTDQIIDFSDLENFKMLDFSNLTVVMNTKMENISYDKEFVSYSQFVDYYLHEQFQINKNQEIIQDIQKYYDPIVGTDLNQKEKLNQIILENLKIKSMNGQNLNNSMLCFYLQNFIDQINLNQPFNIGVQNGQILELEVEFQYQKSISIFEKIRDENQGDHSCLSDKALQDILFQAKSESVKNYLKLKKINNEQIQEFFQKNLDKLIELIDIEIESSITKNNQKQHEKGVLRINEDKENILAVTDNNKISANDFDIILQSYKEINKNICNQFLDFEQWSNTMNYLMEQNSACILEEITNLTDHTDTILQKQLEKERSEQNKKVEQKIQELQRVQQQIHSEEQQLNQQQSQIDKKSKEKVKLISDNDQLEKEIAKKKIELAKAKKGCMIF